MVTNVYSSTTSRPSLWCGTHGSQPYHSLACLSKLPARILILLIVLCVTQECSSQPTTEPVYLGDCTILVDRNTVPGSKVATLSFGIHKQAEAALGDVTLDWNPFEYLKESRLNCLQDTKAQSMSIGESPSADLLLTAPSLERIKKGQEVRLFLHVPRPESLDAGIYQGELKFRFSAPGVLNTDFTGKMNIRVIVRGRRLLSLQFLHAVHNKLRFGSPADVDVQFDTINSELETGELEFSLQPIVAPPPQSLTPLSIPFPPEEFFKDPKLVLKPSTYPKTWNKTAFWTEVSLPIMPDAALPMWKRHSVKVHLGDCDDLGAVRAKLTWPQDENAPGTRAPLETTTTATVIEGVSVVPRIAFRGEKITVTLASKEDLGDEVGLLLVDEKQKPSPIVLKKSVALKSGEEPSRTESEMRASGQPYLYSKDFSSSSLATFAVQFPEDVVKAHPLLAELNDAKNTVNIWLESRARNTPLRVFASSTPFWWDFVSDPDKGSGWSETREKMWDIGFDTGRMGNVSVTLLGMANRPVSSIGTAIDLDLEPILEIKGPSEDKGSLDTRAQWEMITSPLVLQGVASLNQEAIRKKNAIIGQWKFPFRMSIRGVTSKGVKVVRIFESTATVDVTTQWVYYNRILWWCVGVAAFLALLRWIYRRANPKVQFSPDSASSATVISSADDLSDFIPGQLATRPVEDEPAPERQNVQSDDLPSPRKSDDLDDFLA